jgi:hypothetical protein
MATVDDVPTDLPKPPEEPAEPQFRVERHKTIRHIKQVSAPSAAHAAAVAESDEDGWVDHGDADFGYNVSAV